MCRLRSHDRIIPLNPRKTDHVLPFLDVLINNTDPHLSVTTILRWRLRAASRSSLCSASTGFGTSCPFAPSGPTSMNLRLEKNCNNNKCSYRKKTSLHFFSVFVFTNVGPNVLESGWRFNPHSVGVQSISAPCTYILLALF